MCVSSCAYATFSKPTVSTGHTSSILGDHSNPLTGMRRMKQIIAAGFISTLFFCAGVGAQTCDSSFSLTSFTSSDHQQIRIESVIVSQSNEMTIGGITWEPPASASWIIKTKTEGGIDWSKKYRITGYHYFNMVKVLAQPDGSTLVIANTGKNANRTTPGDIQGIVVFQVNRNGGVDWARILKSNYAQTKNTLHADNGILTANGDLVIDIFSYHDTPEIIQRFSSTVWLLCIKSNGELRWTKKIISDTYQLASPSGTGGPTKSLQQLADGTILFGTQVDDYFWHTVVTTKFGYYLAAVDPMSGNRIWDQAYFLKDGLATYQNALRRITALPNGDLSFIAYVRPPGTTRNMRPANMITDRNGRMKKVISYYNSLNSKADNVVPAVEAQGETGMQTILVQQDYDTTDIIFSIDKDGAILRETAFSKDTKFVARGTRASPVLIATDIGFYFAASNTLSVKPANVYHIEMDASHYCVAMPVKMVSEDVTSQYISEDAGFRFEDDDLGSFEDITVDSRNFLFTTRNGCYEGRCDTPTITDPPSTPAPVVPVADTTYPVFMPTGFTPNGDGLNDVLRVPRQNQNGFVSLEIYNRVGQLVFRTTDQRKGWDGRLQSIPQPSASYVYCLVMATASGKRITQNGTVVLIR